MCQSGCRADDRDAKQLWDELGSIQACGVESCMWTEREERKGKKIADLLAAGGVRVLVLDSGHPKLSAPVIINSGGKDLVFLINIQGNPRGVEGPQHPFSSFLFLIFPNLSLHTHPCTSIFVGTLY